MLLCRKPGEGPLESCEEAVRKNVSGCKDPAAEVRAPWPCHDTQSSGRCVGAACA